MARPQWHILLIEDSADDRADLRQMLLRGASRRYRFSEAELGTDGVRQVLEQTQGPVDCVLLDYSMPDMDAPELLAALCQGSDLPPCPVVVITGTEGEDRLSLLGAGAQDYIGKRWTSAESLTRAVENAVERFAMLVHRGRSEAALLAAKDEAERANRAKSDFLLGMSHELRSPLSAMLGFAQLLEAGTPTPTPAQQDSVQHILRAGWYLLGLINEILDLTAIESGRMAVASQAISLDDVLNDCRAMVAPQAQGADIALHFPGPGQACRVQADAMRTRQVLLNLLTNAIKYNCSGGRVDVRCAVVPGRRVRVSVQDTGPGLSAAQLGQLFEPFNRLGQEAGEAQGTGIGLVICKRLVELMGGHMGFESTVGVGSCFWFELDRASALPAPGMPVRTVLYIENDMTRLQRVEQVLAQSPDVCLLRALDVRGGLETARSARPDAILLGVSLRDAAAAQALLQLAKDPATAHIPVIALGSDTAPHDSEAGLAAGCFDFLAQPVHGDVLGHALELAFQRNNASGMRSTTEENSRC